MAKDKKAGKIDTKKAKLAEKKQKQEKKAEKKAKVKASKSAADSDIEDVDLDAVLEEYKKQQEQFHKVTEVVADAPPRARAASCLLASPSNSNQLLLFGGEYFNGAVATFFNDLMVYHIDRDEWRCVTSPNAPLPRSGAAWCKDLGGKVYLFGGEFSSPKQGTFYHYNDFWRLDCATKEWERLEGKGKERGPGARSGHRMVWFRGFVVLFGGFRDEGGSTRYLGDLWVYDVRGGRWFEPKLSVGGLRPEARSGFSLLGHEGGAVMYGGYSRVKGVVGGGSGGEGKKKGRGGRNVMRAVVHQDCWFLRIGLPGADAAPGTLPVVRWERRKKPANAPVPSRAGVTMALHKGRGIMFGGVHDVEESEEGMESEFFGELFAWNIERNRFFPLALRKPRARKGVGSGGGEGRERVGRRGRAAANDEELLKQLAALQAGVDGDEMDVDGGLKVAGKEKEEDKKPVKEKRVSMDLPHMRFNAQLAVQDDVLYIYGGTYEKGDREFTFDDMYAIDLGKMDGCKEIFSRPAEDWIASDDEEDEDDDDEYEDEYMDEEVEEGDIEMEDVKAKFNTASKRKKKADEGSEMGSMADTSSTAASSELDDEGTEASIATTVDDGLPYPRPFESRREFFQRTSNEWQEILMSSIRWKNIQPESLSVKEIKARAFEMSEEKWWDSREEITALEDEQEAAGIGEVVSFADRDAGAGAGAPRRR